MVCMCDVVYCSIYGMCVYGVYVVRLWCVMLEGYVGGVLGGTYASVCTRRGKTAMPTVFL